MHYLNTTFLKKVSGLSSKKREHCLFNFESNDYRSCRSSPVGYLHIAATVSGGHGSKQRKLRPGCSSAHYAEQLGLLQYPHDAPLSAAVSHGETNKSHGDRLGEYEGLCL